MNDTNLALLRQLLQATGKRSNNLVLPLAELQGIDLWLAEDNAVLCHRFRIVDNPGRVQ